MSKSQDLKWEEIKSFFEKNFRKDADLKGILYLIGIREQGWGNGNYKKETKEKLLNLAVCKVLSYQGYFRLKEKQSNFPEWEQIKPFPQLNPSEQDNLLKSAIIEYFECEEILTH